MSILKPVTDKEIQEVINDFEFVTKVERIIATHFKKQGWKESVEWGDELCPHTTKSIHDASITFRTRRDCSYCWVELKQEIGL